MKTTLSADHATWLAETIARNRRQYSGLRMMADDPAGGDDPAPKSEDPKGDSPKQDEPLGEGGKKALESEREARKQAEKTAESLRGEFDGFKKALLEGLGLKDKDATEGDALSAVQKQLADMQHESAVLKLANQHKITDAADLELLGTAKDPEAMKRLAERLAPSSDGTDPKRSKPKADPTQGPKAEDTPSDPGPGMARLRQAYADTNQ